MKKLVYVITIIAAIIVCLQLTGCSGTMDKTETIIRSPIHLESDMKLVNIDNCTLNHGINIKILTRPMRDEENAETYTVYYYVDGIVYYKVDIIETKTDND